MAILKISKITHVIIDIRLNNIIEALKEKNLQRLQRLSSLFMEQMDNTTVTFFSKEEIENINDEILAIELLATLDVFAHAIEQANKLRDWCAKTARERLFITRTLKEMSPSDNTIKLGMIDNFPNLVRYEIANILEKEYSIS
jgi:hypothetical protein